MQKFIRFLTSGASALALSIACLLPTESQAQLSENKDKFLGNITTRYNVDYGNEKYSSLPMIDVVNEAIDGHQDGNPLMKESLAENFDKGIVVIDGRKVLRR